MVIPCERNECVRVLYYVENTEDGLSVADLDVDNYFIIHGWQMP